MALKVVLSGRGHRIRFWVSFLASVKLMGSVSGTVPFSTHARIWSKMVVGCPPVPPEQCSSPGTSKTRKKSLTSGSNLATDS